jgi:hypothetical protein
MPMRHSYVVPMRWTVIYEYEVPEGHCDIKSKNVKHSHYGPMGPRGSGRLRVPESVTLALEGGRLSAIRTGHLYPQEYPGTHFKRLSRPWAHGIVGCHGKNPQ